MSVWFSKEQDGKGKTRPDSPEPGVWVMREHLEAQEASQTQAEPCPPRPRPRSRPHPRPLGALSLNRLSIKLPRPELARRKQAQANESPPGPETGPRGNPQGSLGREKGRQTPKVKEIWMPGKISLGIIFGPEEPSNSP